MSQPLKKERPTEADANFRNEMLVLLDKYTGELPQERMLAVAAYTVGQIIAMQDQTKHSSSNVMNMVVANIMAGNRDAIDHIFGQTEGNA